MCGKRLLPTYYKDPEELKDNMDDKEKTALRNCHQDLVSDLETSPELLYSLLHLGVINDRQKEEIESKSARRTRVNSLLEILPRRGPKAFCVFVRELKKEYSWLSERLREEVDKQRYIDESKSKVHHLMERAMRECSIYLSDDKRDSLASCLSDGLAPTFMLARRNACTSFNSVSYTGHQNTGSSDQIKDIHHEIRAMVLGTSALPNLTSGNKSLVGESKDLLHRLCSQCCECLDKNVSELNEKSLVQLISESIQELKSEIKVLQKDIRKHKKEEVKLKKENEQVLVTKKQVVTLKDSNKKLKEEVKILTKENEKLKTKLDTTKREYDVLAQQVSICQ